MLLFKYCFIILHENPNKARKLKRRSFILAVVTCENIRKLGNGRVKLLILTNMPTLVKNEVLRGLRREGWVPFIIAKEGCLVWVKDQDAVEFYRIVKPMISKTAYISFSFFLAFKAIKQVCGGKTECVVLRKDVEGKIEELMSLFGVELNHRSLAKAINSVKELIAGKYKITITDYPMSKIIEEVGDELPSNKTTIILTYLINEFTNWIDRYYSEILRKIEERGWARINITRAYRRIEHKLRSMGIINGKFEPIMRNIIKHTNIELIDTEHGIKGERKGFTLVLTNLTKHHSSF